MQSLSIAFYMLLVPLITQSNQPYAPWMWMNHFSVLSFSTYAVAALRSKLTRLARCMLCAKKRKLKFVIFTISQFHVEQHFTFATCASLNRRHNSGENDIVDENFHVASNEHIVGYGRDCYARMSLNQSDRLGIIYFTQIAETSISIQILWITKFVFPFSIQIHPPKTEKTLFMQILKAFF